MNFKTRNGQTVAPYQVQENGFPTVRAEGGKRYRLCQILPPVPQRFEWVNEDNLVRVR